MATATEGAGERLDVFNRRSQEHPMTHTPEPWRATRAHEQYDGPYWDIEPEEAEEYAARPYTGIEAAGNLTVVAAHDLFTFRPGDAERIVACVNVCAGMDDPEKEIGRLRDIEMADQVRLSNETVSEIIAEEVAGLRDALRALVGTVNATGGLVVGEDHKEGPAGDPEWGDLADAYRMACEVLGVEPVIGDGASLENFDDA